MSETFAFSLEELEAKHAACVAALDAEKNCTTCMHFELKESEHPCCNCYSSLVGFPINPTKWEPAQEAA